MRIARGYRRNVFRILGAGVHAPRIPTSCWQWVAVALVAGSGRAISASTETWDPDNTGPTTGVPADDVGTWGNAASDWYNAAPGTAGGSDVVWPNDGVTVAQFGDPFGTAGVTGTAGTVNLGTNISAGGLILNTPAAGNYTINASVNGI